MPRDAAAKIAAVASAPAYGPYSTYVGNGIVGSSTFTFEAIGEAVADLALEALRGNRIDNVMVPQTYLADARQLARWGLLQARLPPGTRLSFAEPTLWQQHRTSILVTFAIVLIQALIISALLVERRRRATAELEARRRLLEVVHLNQSATAGALSASIAHELNQPLGAILQQCRGRRDHPAERAAGHASSSGRSSPTSATTTSGPAKSSSGCGAC